MEVNQALRAVFWEAEREPLRLLHMSPYVEEVFGYTPQQWFDRRFWAERVHPEDTEAVLDYGLHAIREGIPHDFSYRFCRADGEYIWVRDIVEVRGNRLHGVLMDISEEKKQQENLKNSEERFRKFFQEDRSVKLLIDAENGQIVDANSAAAEFYGYTQTELTRMNINQINTLSPEQVAREMEHARRQERQYFNFRHRLKSGEVRRVEVYSTPIELGKQSYLHSVIHDVTEIEYAVQALRESEQRYRSITEYAPIGIAIHVGNKVGYVNPEGLRILEAEKPEDVIGKPTTDFVSSESLETVRERRTALLDTQEWKALNPEDETLISVKGNLKHCLITSLAMDYEGKRAVYSVFTDITERKKTQNRLRQSEQRYRSITELAPVGIVVHLKNEVKYANPEALRIVGADSLESIRHTSILRYIKPERRPFVMERVRKLYANEIAQAPPEDETIVRLDGTERYCIITGIIMEYEGKQAVYSVISDLTERIRVEQQLKESEQRYRLLADNITDFVTLHDTDLVYKYVSPSHRQLGYTPEDLLGISAFKFIHPEDHGLIRSALQLDYEQDTVTYRVRHKNGYYRWVETSARFIKDPETEAPRLLAVTRDVDERIRMEQDLEHSRALLSAVFRKSTDGILIVGTDRRIQDCNQRVVELFEGESREDFIGKSGEDFELEAKRSLREVTKVLDRGDSVLNRQVKYLTLKQNTFWGNFAARRFKIRDRQYTLVIVTDITRLKEMEQKMEALYETEQSLNAQLMEHNEELKRINNELDNFVYRVSHDLRAPLTSSLGLIELSKRSASLEEIKEYTALQEKSLTKLDTFIQDIVHYSRNARLEVVPEEIDIKVLFEQLLEQLQFAPKSKDVKKEVSIKSSPFAFVSDRRRVEMILSNLLSNSIRYSDLTKENPKVEVTVEIEPEQVYIQVRDNGYGIKEEYRDKVFEMFFRGTLREPGSGLGLYIVQEAIRKLNGEIRLDSTYGEGSRFYVKLPNLIGSVS